MYGNPYYNAQMNIDRINNQIAELEKMRSQIPTQPMQPTNLTQNFQIAPTAHGSMRYANTIEDVNKEAVITDTPFFSKDLSIVWIKNAKGDIKSYELKEIIVKDDKDLQIEYLRNQIEELKGMINNARSDDKYVDEPVKEQESTDVPVSKPSTKKSK